MTTALLAALAVTFQHWIYSQLNSNLAGNVLAAASAVAALVLSAWSRLISPRSRRRAVWTFKNISLDVTPGIIIDHVAGEKTDLYTRPSTGYGAVRAVAQITNSLNSSRSGFFNRSQQFLEHPIEVCFATDQLASEWLRTRDVILVGGPKNNEITAEVLSYWGGYELREPPAGDVPAGDLSRSMRIWTDGNTIHWFGETHTGDVADTKPEVRGNVGFNGIDYGIALRLPSPSDPKNLRVVVLFGSQTFGIMAATDWLVRQGGSRDKSWDGSSSTRSLRRSENLAVLLRSRVHNGVIERSELMDIRPLDSHLIPARWTPA